MTEESNKLANEVIHSSVQIGGDNTTCALDRTTHLKNDNEIYSNEEPELKDFIWQIIASCIVHCLVIQAGINMVYGTILTDELKTEDGDLKANEQEISWITSLVTITLPLGSLIVGPLMDKFGRKKLCMVPIIPIIISWFLLLFAKSLPVIYLARIIAGIGAGLTSIGMIYITEITHPKIRPMMLCLNSVFVSLGILLTCTLAIGLDWREMAIFFIVMNFFILGLLYPIPESPFWLAYTNNNMVNPEGMRKIEKNLRWLNRKEVMFKQEYARIKESYETRVQNDSAKTLTHVIQNYCQQLSLPHVYKPIVILFVFLLLQQLSGTYVVIFYAHSVFEKIQENFSDTLDQKSSLAILGVVRFVISVITVFLSKKYGRRPLSIISGLGMAISMITASVYMYISMILQDDNVKDEMDQFSWLLSICIFMFICTSSLGFAVIPWTLIGELLPISVRGVGGGIMVSVTYVMMFIVVKNYHLALQVLDVPGTFGFFGIMSLLGTAFVYIFLPETLGKSFLEIENYFRNEKSEKFRNGDKLMSS